MPVFKKKEGVDVLDLTNLHKKGLLKIQDKKIQTSVKINSAGYVDLGVDSSPPTNSSNTDGGALSFLDSLASSSSDSVKNFTSPTTNNSVELEGLKNKIEDLEYKIRILEDKLAKLED